MTCNLDIWHDNGRMVLHIFAAPSGTTREDFGATIDEFLTFAALFVPVHYPNDLLTMLISVEDNGFYSETTFQSNASQEEVEDKFTTFIQTVADNYEWEI